MTKTGSRSSGRSTRSKRTIIRKRSRLSGSSRKSTPCDHVPIGLIVLLQELREHLTAIVQVLEPTMRALSNTLQKQACVDERRKRGER